jgi:hypothetical protein
MNATLTLTPEGRVFTRPSFMVLPHTFNGAEAAPYINGLIASFSVTGS